MIARTKAADVFPDPLLYPGELHAVVGARILQAAAFRQISAILPAKSAS
jgi:hypothetical protein